MKFSINRALLIGALKQSKQIAKGGGLPALAGVLVKACGGGVSITASNISSRLEQTIQGEIGVAGDFLVSCDRLFDVVSQIKEDSVSITATQSKGAKEIEIKGGKIKAKLFCLSVDEFPQKRDVASWPVSFQTDTDFCDLLAKVAVGVNPNDTRATMCGVHFANENNRVSLVGTDGRRLHLQETEIPVNGRLSANVPCDAVSAIGSIFDGHALRISVSETAMEIRSGDSVFSFQLIEGEYPRFRVIVPAESSDKVSLPKAEILSAVESASSIVAREKSNGVLVSIGKSGVNIAASASEIGEMDIDLPHPSKITRKFKISGPFFCQALRQFEGEEISLENESPTSLITIREGGFTAVIMPMRTDS